MKRFSVRILKPRFYMAIPIPPIRLAARRDLASLDIFEAENVLARIAGIEAQHRFQLERLKEIHAIKHPRVLGSIAAFDVAEEGATYGSKLSQVLRDLALKEGLILRPLGSTLYLMPPYAITDAELEAGYDGIGRILQQLR